MSALPGSVVTIGETMGLFYSDTPGSLAHAARMGVGIGGSESNVAIGLARLGIDSTWIGRVGDDSLGRRIVRELRAEGVTARVAIDREAPTGLMIKEHQTPEATTVWYYRSGNAGSRLCPEDIHEEDVANAALLHLTGITPALSDQAYAAVLKAAHIARDAHVPISFDINYRASVWNDRNPQETMRTFIKMATVVFTGEQEGRLIFPEAPGPADLAGRIAELGPAQVIVKRGADGCCALIDHVLWHEAAIPIRTVDTVGAGDAFAAGYLAELVSGEASAVRLRTASTTAAFACLNRGDWEGFPRREDFGLLTAAEPITR